MKDNKLKIAITCPHCDFESKTNLFSYRLKILCTRCKKDFILDDLIKVKYSFYCPHCNKYGSSRNIFVGKKAICRKCRGEMLISKQGVKRIGKTFGNVVKLFFFIFLTSSKERFTAGLRFKLIDLSNVSKSKSSID